MFKKRTDMKLETIENLQGGKGKAQLLEIFSQDELKGKCRLFKKITLEPGCSIGTHSHDQEEEIYYILSGKGIVEDNGKVFEIEAGDALKTGGGEFHSITNNGTEPLVFMAVVIFLIKMEGM